MVYFFTYHAYLSWLPDRNRGFVQKHKPGVQLTNVPLANAYRGAARGEPVLFTARMQRLMIETVLDVCRRRGWRVHAAATEPTHLHALVSWRELVHWRKVRGKIKNIVSLELSKKVGPVGRRWFAKKASRKRVRRMWHYRFLMGKYVPKHKGWSWYEDGRGWVDQAQRK